MVAEPGGPRERGRPRIAERIVDVLVPLIMEEIVEIVKVVCQERIAKRICEQIVDVDGSQVAEQDTEAPKTSSRDRTSQRTVEQNLNAPVPEMAKQLVEMPKTVSPGRIQQRTVEQIIDASVPQTVEELAEVSKVFSLDGVQQRFGEQIIETPTISLAEKIVEMPITRKTQQGVNTHVQHVVNAVEVEKHVVQEKINQETKRIEIPPLHFMDKAIDIPVVAQRQVPQVHVVKKTVEDPQFEIVQKTVENPETVPQLRDADKVVDVPVVLVLKAPQVQVSEETVEISQLQAVEQIVQTRETQMIQSTQTSEKLGTAPVCRPTQAEIVEAVEIEVPLPAESASPMSVTEPVLEVPPIVGKIDEIPEIRTDVGTQTSESSGTALVEDAESSVLKTPDSIKAHDQASSKTTRNPNGESYPAFASEKSWNEASGKTVAHRQVPLIQKIQKMVEVPQIQYIDKVVDGPVEMQPAPEMELVTSTLATTEYIASATGVTDIVATNSSLRKRKSSGSLQSPRVRPGTRTPSM